MSDDTTWVFPYPTGVNINHLYEGSGTRRKLTDKAFTWREETRLIVRQSHYRPEPPFRIDIQVFPPNRIRRDLDGLCKATIDSVFLELGIDDTMENLSRILMRAMRPGDQPAIVVRLQTWKGAN